MRHSDRRNHATDSSPANDQCTLLMKPRSELLTDIFQAQPAAHAGAQPHTIVGDAHRKLLAFTVNLHGGTHNNIAAGRTRLDAMLDGIFHEGDQHEGRKCVTTQVFRHVHRISQAMAHPNLHDSEVARAHLELLRQRGVRRPDFGAKLRHGGTQMIDQGLDSRLCAGRIGPYQRVNRGKRVEQKMRLNLLREYTTLILWPRKTVRLVG